MTPLNEIEDRCMKLFCGERMNGRREGGDEGEKKLTTWLTILDEGIAVISAGAGQRNVEKRRF